MEPKARLRLTRPELEYAIRAALRPEPPCGNLVFSVRYADATSTGWTVVPPPGHGWAPHCWRRLAEVAAALQARYDLAPEAVTTDQLAPIVMRETLIELGADRRRFATAPPPKVDVFPGGRWTASPGADVPREYWTAFRRAVRRLQHEVEVVPERSTERVV